MTSSTFQYCHILAICYINWSFAFKIGTYNTFQNLQSNHIAEDTRTRQLSEINASDIDVLCLQEIFTPSIALAYEQTYPYSVSETQSFDFNLPRAPCSDTQITQFTCISSICGSVFPNSNLLAGCAFTFCQAEAFQLVHSECINCVAFCADIPECPTDSIANAIEFCAQPLPFTTALFDGTILLSKYPIINTWHITIPSFIPEESAITFAEISVCSLTQSESSSTDSNDNNNSDSNDNNSDSNDNNCNDTIIVGCTHLVATGSLDQSIFFPVSQQQIDQGITTFTELNAYQSEYIMEHILNENDAPWVVDGDNNNVIAVFITGDLNIGKKQNPQNLQIWTDNQYITGRDFMVISEQNVFDGCTYCADPNGTDLPNPLAIQFCMVNDCGLIDTDLDHVLVFDEGNYRMIEGLNFISYNREFTDIFVINNMSIPLSDHYGISLEIQFTNDNDFDLAKKDSNSLIDNDSIYQRGYSGTTNVVISLTDSDMFNLSILFVLLNAFIGLLCLYQCMKKKNEEN